MSETPAALARSSFSQPLAAMSSAICCTSYLTAAACVSIANRTLHKSCSQCQQQSSPGVHNANRGGDSLAAMARRPVFHPELGAFFEELREKRGWTQSQAADLAQRRDLHVLTRQVLLRLEDGKTKNPEPEVLRAVAVLYEVPYDDLVAKWVATRFGTALSAEGRDLVRHSGGEDRRIGDGGVGGDDSIAARALERERQHHQAVIEKLEETLRGVFSVLHNERERLDASRAEGHARGASVSGRGKDHRAPPRRRAR